MTGRMRRGAAFGLVLWILALPARAQVDVDGDGRPDPVASTAEADVGGRKLVLVTTARPPGAAALLAEKTAAGLVPLWRGAIGPRDVDAEWAVAIDLASL